MRFRYFRQLSQPKNTYFLRNSYHMTAVTSHMHNIEKHNSVQYFFHRSNPKVFIWIFISSIRLFAEDGHAMPEISISAYLFNSTFNIFISVHLSSAFDVIYPNSFWYSLCNMCVHLDRSRYGRLKATNKDIERPSKIYWLVRVFTAYYAISDNMFRLLPTPWRTDRGWKRLTHFSSSASVSISCHVVHAHTIAPSDVDVESWQAQVEEPFYPPLNYTLNIFYNKNFELASLWLQPELIMQLVSGK